MTELASALSTTPPRNIVKLVAQPCTMHAGSCFAPLHDSCETNPAQRRGLIAAAPTWLMWPRYEGAWCCKVFMFAGRG